MSAPVTPRMSQCMGAIRRLTVNGVAPSYDELQADMGLASKSNVHRILTSLRARGLVEWEPCAGRSLRVVEEDLTPARLERMSNEQLRQGAALIAGILAHREGRNLTGSTYRRIADRIELKPNEARA